MGQNQYKKVAFHTLGCKLNFSESSTIARGFIDAGYAKVEFEDAPDIFVINTCSVTENADKKCRSLVRKAKRLSPEAKVVMIGCYAQLKPEEIVSIEGVDLVLGANEKFNILEHLDKANENDSKAIYDKIKYTRDFVPSYSAADRTRSFLKVQDGCDYFCSFCTIPLARGRSRSANIEDTIKSAEEVAQTEVKEVVLTGVNIGDFGAGSDETFLDLAKALDQVDGIERFRISSIEPNLLNNDVIKFVNESNKFVPHFHIPLQSGNDELLKKMRRRYDRALYTDRVETIKQLMPDCCIGVDVIVGFPGETEAHFNDTVEYLTQLDVSYLHVFTYSERANTTAVRMDEAIDMGVRRQRSRQLQILSQKKKRAFYQKFIGQTREVLFESNNDNGTIHGFTDNYLKVTADFDESLCNTLKSVRLNQINEEGLFEVDIL